EMTLDAIYQEKKITICSMDMHGPWGKLEGDGVIDLQETLKDCLWCAGDYKDNMGYDVKIKGSEISVQKLLSSLGWSLDLSDKLEGAVHFKGKSTYPQNISAELHIDGSIKNATFNHRIDPATINIQAHAHMHHSVIQLDECRFFSNNDMIKLSGKYWPFLDEIQSILSAEIHDINPYVRSLNIPHLKGQFISKINMDRASIKKLQTKLDLHGTNTWLSDMYIGNVKIKALLDPTGTLNMSEVVLGELLSAKGSIRLWDTQFSMRDDFPLQVRGNLNVDLGNLHIDDRICGNIKSTWTIQGTLFHPMVTADLVSDGFSIYDIPFSRADISLHYAKGFISTPQAMIQLDSFSTVQLQGWAKIMDEQRLTWIQNPSFFMQIKNSEIYLEEIMPWMSGILNVSTTFEGSLKHPNATVSLQGTNLSFGAEKFDQVDICAYLENDNIIIDTFDLIPFQDERIQGKLWCNLAGDYDLKLQTEGINIQRMNLLKEIASLHLGNLSFQVEGKGNLANPQLFGSIRLQDWSVENKPMNDLVINVNINDTLIYVDLISDIHATAYYDLKDQNMVACINFAKMNLKPYFEMLKQPDITGQINGNIIISGNPFHMDQLNMFIDLIHLSVHYKDQSLIRTDHFQAECVKGYLNIPDAKLFVLDQGILEISSANHSIEDIHIGIRGKLPVVTLMKSIDPELVDTYGNIRLLMDIYGNILKPDIQCQLFLEDVNFTVPFLFQKIKNMNGSIQIQPHEINICTLNGMYETGQFDLVMNVFMDDWFNPIQIKAILNAHNLPISIPETMDILLNTHLELTGTDQNSLIQGQIVLLEGLYYKDVVFNLFQKALLFNKKRIKNDNSIAVYKTYPLIENVHLDISVNKRNPFLIQNNIANLEINPDIKLSGKILQPVLSGRASIEKGTITYLKKHFEVQKGVIDFIDPYKIAPYIDFYAESTIRGRKIQLGITGELFEELNIQLTSNPMEEDWDILSLIAFGKTTEELTSQKDVASKSATQRVAEMMSAVLSDQVQETTGIDTFSVETETETETERTTDTDGVKVTLGKDLSRRMSVHYSVETKQGNIIQKTAAEYKLLDNLLINGFQDTQGGYGGEFQYRIEFR
ncbi:MAG: translocation/assembly module TamB domain-containing protein, partial [Desulfobacterales bacterium]|nr:translocation/assembly module TamB domain-containing protein [Desulfobacterales bacterium]